MSKEEKVKINIYIDGLAAPVEVEFTIGEFATFTDDIKFSDDYIDVAQYMINTKKIILIELEQ